MLNAKQFPVVAQTYLGVRQSCLEGLTCLPIRQKAGGVWEDKLPRCDPCGENLAKGVLPCNGWTYHHDAIDVHIHNIAKQATLTSETEITYYFMGKLEESAIHQNSHLPILTSKQLKGYVPNARHTGIATNKHPTGVDQFIEVKVIHNGCVQYGGPQVQNNHEGAAVVQYFQGHVRQQYISQMKRKDGVHFGAGTNDRGPLETLFRHLDFKPMVFGKNV
jgi:hypothetical protein